MGLDVHVLDYMFNFLLGRALFRLIIRLILRDSFRVMDLVMVRVRVGRLGIRLCGVFGDRYAFYEDGSIISIYLRCIYMEFSLL